MDALLCGVTKSLDYLGEQKRVILDKMGDLMLEYLIEVGAVKSPDKPKQFELSLRELLTKNGFGARIPIEFEGNPPTPSIADFVNYLEPKNQRAPKKKTLPSERGVEERRKVDWVLFEMTLYGITKALDDLLGAQAQLILSRIGTEMLSYLVERRLIEPSDDPLTFVEHVKDFFLRAGYAGNFEFKVEGSPPNSWESTYESARYFKAVFSRLRNQGSALLSCPLCLAGQSIITRAQGIKFGSVVEFQILPGDKVLLRSNLYPPAERFTEEDAKKISQMKA